MRSSQTDLLVLAGSDDGLVAMCVEGKVDEAFGPLISAWLTDEARDGKRERLAFLCETLGLAEDALPALRCQLLHRTVSSLIEAETFGARHALMLVHSFSPTDAGLDDYQRFADALGIENAEPDRIVTAPERRDGRRLHLGWVRGEERFLRA